MGAVAWIAACSDHSAGPTEPLTPFVALAAGEGDSCALTKSGAAYCWGEGFGPRPVAVAPGVQFTLLTGGGGPICGLTSAGRMYCPSGWPLATGAAGWTFNALAATDDHACGVTSTGAAYCWGDGMFGQLGDSSFSWAIRWTPVAVYGGLTFKAVATGPRGHTCGLTTDGAAYCWGHGNAGELGNGSRDWSSTPVAVAGGLTFAALVAGFLSTCGLTPDGVAYCWGDNHWGQLGGDSCAICEGLTPSPVAGRLTFVALAAGWQHNCGLTGAGAAYCWGLNEYGQLGSSTTGSSDPLVVDSRPHAVAGRLSFSAIAPGWRHTCGLTSAGAAYCWGDNTYGQLGNGSTTSSVIPVPVAPF